MGLLPRKVIKPSMGLPGTAIREAHELYDLQASRRLLGKSDVEVLGGSEGAIKHYREISKNFGESGRIPGKGPTEQVTPNLSGLSKRARFERQLNAFSGKK